MPLPSDAKPSSVTGNRNFDCPYYMLCLDIAAAQMWPDFSCQQCPYLQSKQQNRIDEVDLCVPGWEDIWSNN